MSKEYTIDENNIYLLDKNFTESDSLKLEKEIEYIIDSLWKGCGKYESILQPLCVSHLNITWLRRLYIYYFSLKKLKEEYSDVYIKGELYLFNIFKDELNLKILKGGKNLNGRFYLEHYLQWLENSKSNFIKRFIKRIYYYLSFFRKLNILYLNAGKLYDDIKPLKNKFNADCIEINNNILSIKELNTIQQQVRENIKSLNVSIPIKILESFFEDKLIKFIPKLLIYIHSVSEFIDKRKIKLVLISTTAHDMHLSLLMASKISGIPCLMVGHGLIVTKNPYLDKIKFYNARISEFECAYKKSVNLKILPKWLHAK